VRLESRDATAAADRIRETATGAISVVGILIPLTIIAQQIRASASRPGGAEAITASVLIDLLVASLWLLTSLVLGLYVLYYSAFNGYDESLLTHKQVPVLFGFQLFFLMVGVIRLVTGLVTLASEQVSGKHSFRLPGRSHEGTTRRK
jgi:hypothetical protein